MYMFCIVNLGETIDTWKINHSCYNFNRFISSQSLQNVFLNLSRSLMLKIIDKIELHEATIKKNEILDKFFL